MLDPAVYDLPYPKVDFAAVADPVAAILRSPEFTPSIAFLADQEAAQRSLVSGVSLGLLYCMVRNMKPEHSVEIGTYKAGTTDTICRALHANGHGIIHTVDPYGDVHGAPEILAAFPPELAERVRFYPLSSMDFYVKATQSHMSWDLVFVDGHHAYEYALFDIQCGAQLINPGGLIVIDNISQPGPFVAAQDFLKLHPEWHELGNCGANYKPQLAFDRNRASIEGTDFCIIRAPWRRILDRMPFTIGHVGWVKDAVESMTVSIAEPATGRLNVQCVLRSFGEPWREWTAEQQIKLVRASGEMELPLRLPCPPELIDVARSVEPWLTWEGETPLVLAAPPTLSC